MFFEKGEWFRCGIFRPRASLALDAYIEKLHSRYNWRIDVTFVFFHFALRHEPFWMPVDYDDID